MEQNQIEIYFRTSKAKEMKKNPNLVRDELVKQRLEEMKAEGL